MKIIILAVMAALAAGSAAVIAPAEAASPAIRGDSGHTYRRDDYWHDNGRHLGWQKQRRRHEMRLRERREVQECRIITHRYWRNGRRVSERVNDCD